MKRGESGLSLLVAVDKPRGLTSHDVVNRCRRIFGEKRCGHTGTLDPLATGVLPICVGPATRLDRFMVSHDKRYRVTVAFGCGTDTDDSEGTVTETASVPSFLLERDFAESYLEKMLGVHMQVPPAYSAVKVGGVKACDAARKGKSMELEPRRVEVYDAKLVDICSAEGGLLEWVVDFHVSKGTYIRSLARDMGENLTCPAHVAALARHSAGRIGIRDCMSLESIEALGVSAALDPVRVLGLRYAFADSLEKRVSCGNSLPSGQLELNEPLPMPLEHDACACMGGVRKSDDFPVDDELAAIIVGNRLKALYRFCECEASWKAECVFPTPVFRG